MKTVPHDALQDEPDGERSILKILATEPEPPTKTWVWGEYEIVENFWTDSEWERLTEAQRPRDAQHWTGTGWSLVSVRRRPGSGS